MTLREELARLMCRWERKSEDAWRETAPKSDAMLMAVARRAACAYTNDATSDVSFAGEAHVWLDAQIRTPVQMARADGLEARVEALEARLNSALDESVNEDRVRAIVREELRATAPGSRNHHLRRDAGAAKEDAA
jgi:hypothetical protein